MISIFKSKRSASERASNKASQQPTGLTLEQLQQQVPDASARHLQTILHTQHSTMTSPSRVLALCEATEYICKHQLPGDFVECGVWRGGSSAAAARTLLQQNSSDRTIWLYDTFEGMTEPTENDVDFMGRNASQLLQNEDQSDERSIWCCSGLQDVKRTMLETGYPESSINFVTGRVEETLLKNVPDQIALLRLDTDWYESTLCELNVLFPRLVPGGVLIIDDYGHWNGCRKAVDEYFLQHQTPIFFNRIDYTGRLAIK